MTGKHHLIAGTTTGLCCVASILISGRVEFAVAGVIPATMIGSLFPDIDSSTSKLGSKMKITSKIIGLFFGHRGFLHSPLFIVGFMLLLNYIFTQNGIVQYNYLWQCFSFGMMSHLVCDMCTKGGIPLLYPFNRGKFSFTWMKSGSKREFIPLTIVCILTVLSAILLISGGTFL